MVATPNALYPAGRSEEVLVALRGLLSRNPCAAHFGAETFSELLYEGGDLSYRAAAHEIECLLEVLRVEGEVLA